MSYGSYAYGSVEYGGEIEFTTTFFKTLTEALDLTDNLTKTLSRTLSNTTLLSDTVTAFRVFLKTLTEALVVSDTLLRTIGKVIVNTLNTSDTILKSITRSIANTLNLADTITVNQTFIKILSESLILSDSIFRYLNGQLIDIWERTSFILSTWAGEPVKQDVWTIKPVS